MRNLNNREIDAVTGAARTVTQKSCIKDPTKSNITLEDFKNCDPYIIIHELVNSTYIPLYGVSIYTETKKSIEKNTSISLDEHNLILFQTTTELTVDGADIMIAYCPNC